MISPRTTTRPHVLTVLVLLAAPALPAQSALPSTAPTVSTAQAAPPPSRAEAPVAAADIRFTGGKLEVVAAGASLNQVLRDIARLTSITITGRVNEERVFGSYGPGTTGEVLSSLLDGTGINMLLRESTSSRSGELILAPRDGSASPSGPGSASFTNSADPVPPARQSYTRPNSSSPPAPWQPAAQPAPSADPPPPAATTTGPLTPDQIYQQLRRLQQSQPHH